jgi:protein ImuA
MRRFPVPFSMAAAPAAVSSLSESLNESHEQRQARDLIEMLRRHIARTEDKSYRIDTKRTANRNAPLRSMPWALGLDEVDSFLSLKGLHPHALHDIAPERYGDFPAASGFALALARCRLNDVSERRPILWCRLEREQQEYGRSYGHGLRPLGIARDRFLTVTLKRAVNLFWTMEEALKSGALSLVLGDAAPQHCTLTVTRRLSLASAKGKSAGFLIFAAPHNEATSSQTRWRVKTEMSHPPPFEPQAPGAPVWTVSLLKARSGRQGSWTLTWQEQRHKDHASHRFALVSRFPRGALHPGAAEGESPRSAAGPALRAG